MSSRRGNWYVVQCWYSIPVSQYHGYLLTIVYSPTVSVGIRSILLRQHVPATQC